MGEDDGSTPQPERVGDNIAHRQGYFSRISGVMFDVEAAGGIIDMGDQQLLARLALET